ncbi:MAG: hypothetical protein ACRBFS_19810 [Aureispira sp.]
MATKKTTVQGTYRVRVVYGFKEKLKVVLLGSLESGKLQEGLAVQLTLESGSIIGTWEILEVLHTSFINQHEDPNFKGLMLKCKNLADFELLKSLRVYEEIIHLVEK